MNLNEHKIKSFIRYFIADIKNDIKSVMDNHFEKNKNEKLLAYWSICYAISFYAILFWAYANKEYHYIGWSLSLVLSMVVLPTLIKKTKKKKKRKW